MPEPIYWVTESEYAEAGKHALARDAYAFDEVLASLMSVDDPLGQVLRCQLFIEELLIEFIKERFFNPEEAENLNHYDTIVTIAVGLGIHSWMKGPLRKLGSIRDTLAHKRRFDLDRKLAHEFRTCFSATAQQEMQSRHAALSEKYELPPKLEDVEPQGQFSACIIELHRELTRLIEAIKIAKERKP